MPNLFFSQNKCIDYVDGISCVIPATVGDLFLSFTIYYRERKQDDLSDKYRENHPFFIDLLEINEEPFISFNLENLDNSGSLIGTKLNVIYTLDSISDISNIFINEAVVSSQNKVCRVRKKKELEFKMSCCKINLINTNEAYVASDLKIWL